MLHSLKITGFRAFSSFEMKSLSRVNLLVGPNNSGKTSVLEAVEVLNGDGSGWILTRGPARRGERRDAARSSASDVMVNLLHLFHGRPRQGEPKFLVAGTRLLEDNADRTQAWSAVVEGEATFVAHKWTFDRMQQPLPEAEAPEPLAVDDEELPHWISRWRYMPYEEGAYFVHKVFDQGGWKAVNGLFRDPPSSTQQVLHLEKYFQRQEPVEIVLPALARFAGPKAHELDRSTLGEWGVRVMLEVMGAKSDAPSVAAGWRGDRYEALELADQSVVIVWLSLWESETAGKAFVDADRPGLQKQHNGVENEFVLERHGDEVLLVAGASPELMGKLAARAWASGTREGHLTPMPSLLTKPDARDFAPPKADSKPEADGAFRSPKPPASKRARVTNGNSMEHPSAFDARRRRVPTRSLRRHHELSANDSTR